MPPSAILSRAIMIGQLAGNYRVVRQIAQGGMGVVYEAVHEHIRRRAAVKVLSPLYSRNEEICQRFFNEALAVNVVEHPGIVGIFESGRLPDGNAFIVMEYLDGEPLRARIQRDGAFSEAEALQVGRQVASALHAAHEKGIIHRDLKSDNVMLIADPEVPGLKRVKVLDFGIAKVAAEHQVNAVLTRDGVIMGTPEYMSPEQWMSAKMVDAKSDVYALGVMLYEMLAGRYPFDAQNPNEWMAKHMYEAPIPLGDRAPGVSGEVADLVHRLLNKTRAGRPAMAWVMGQIEQLIGRSAGARTVSNQVAALSEMASPTLPELVMAPPPTPPRPQTVKVTDPTDSTVMARDLRISALDGSDDMTEMLPRMTAQTFLSTSTPDLAQRPGKSPWRPLGKHSIAIGVTLTAAALLGIVAVLWH